MEVWSSVCVVGMILSLPLLFKSYEHECFRKKYGKEKGDKLAEKLGIVSGYLYFGFWAAIWFVPQDRFTIDALSGAIFIVPLIGIASLSIPLDQFIIGLPFIIPGAWLGLTGVRTVTLRVAEYHRPEKIVISGIYAHLRHPQYLGGVLSHIGMSLILSAFESLLLTPVVIAINYLVARKEEIELLHEFGEKYREYKKRVPMFIPRP